MDELELIRQLTPEIPEDSDYWLVRTEGGTLFDPFVKNGCISIGYPKITLRMIKAASDTSTPEEALRSQVEKYYPEIERPGLVVSQLLRFTYLIRQGDYVIIPSASAESIAIGRVLEDEFVHKRLYLEDKLIPNFNKLKSVKWMRVASRQEINPNLYRLLNSHQAISFANEYAMWVDGLLYDFFRKGPDYHLLIDVQEMKGVKARTLFQGCLSLLDVSDKFCREARIKENSDEIETKISLNSPGVIELIGQVATLMFVVGAIIVGLNGGAFRLTIRRLGIDVELKTKGLIKSISEFLDSARDRELKSVVREKLESLKMRNPNEIVSIIRQINEEDDHE